MYFNVVIVAEIYFLPNKDHLAMIDFLARINNNLYNLVIRIK